MTKSKATFVTAVMTAMLLAILAFLLLLDVKFAFFGICGVFTLMGLVWADAILLGWLTDKEEEEDLPPIEIAGDEEAPVDEDYKETYDAIRRELGGDEL